MKILLALAFLALCAPSHATVLIYKGTVTRKARPTSTFLPPKYTSYLLYEPETNRIARIAVFQENGEKVVRTEPVNTLRRIELDASQGRVATALAFAFALVTDANNFSDSMSYFRGTNATLAINSAGQTQNHPRVFACTRRVSQKIAGAANYAEEGATYVFQEGRTKPANDAGQTIDAALSALAQALGG